MAAVHRGLEAGRAVGLLLGSLVVAVEVVQLGDERARCVVACEHTCWTTSTQHRPGPTFPQHTPGPSDLHRTRSDAAGTTWCRHVARSERRACARSMRVGVGEGGPGVWAAAPSQTASTGALPWRSWLCAVSVADLPRPPPGAAPAAGRGPAHLGHQPDVGQGVGPRADEHGAALGHALALCALANRVLLRVRQLDGLPGGRSRGGGMGQAACSSDERAASV